MKATPVVLFLCAGNSCRSQMAEGFLRTYAGGRFDVCSAGTTPVQEIHPLTVQVMAERGIDISEQVPKGVGNYLGNPDIRHVIFVCQEAEKSCPRTFPGMVNRTYWPFDDPASFGGTPAEAIERFRAIRDQIDHQIKNWMIDNP